MAHTAKRRITTNLLHAAFVLLFLRGNIPYNLDNFYRLNNGNYSSPSEYFLGPTWGYTQTDFHRYNNYNNDIYIHPKALNSFDYDYPQYDFLSDHHINDILDVIQSPSIQSFRSNISPINKVSPPVPVPFQNNVTAYLVSNTNVNISNQLPSLPSQVQPALLLSVNVDVPPSSASSSSNNPNNSSSSSSNNNNNQDNISNLNLSQDSTSSSASPSLLTNPLRQLVESHQDHDNNHNNEDGDNNNNNIFRFISGNIVLLPEGSDETDDGHEEAELLASIKLSSEFNQDEAIGATSRTTSTPPNVEDIIGLGRSGEEEAVFDELGLLWPQERLWDELSQDFDEQYSLDLALQERENRIAMTLLELEDEDRYTGYSDDENMMAIPPMQLHTHSDDDDDVTAIGNDNNNNNNTAIPSSSSSVSGHMDSAWDANEDSAAALDSIFDELWETDSGVFEALLSPAEEQQRCTDTEENPSEPCSPLNEVQRHNENSNISDGIVDESGDEEDSVSLNESDMIQTASIYSNARPTSHPSQPRGFQVHGRMQGLLRGGNMDQRWQELASLLSLQGNPQHDPNSLPPPLPHHHFPPHHHHHHHHLHHPTSSLHHPMHHPPFSSAGPPPAGAYHHSDMGRSVLLHNASLPVPPPDLTNVTYSNGAMGPPPNLGSALASSMHLTNSSDPSVDPSSNYKMPEHHHDMIYYPNMTTNGEMHNQSTEGLLSSILNEDDLLDMAVNEGLYTMRMMDNTSGPVHSSVGLPPSHPSACSVGTGGVVLNNTVANPEDRMEASSDSAVSSMGSERVPPMTDPHMSDTEWTDAPDPHPHGSHDSNYSSDYNSKLRYEYYGKDNNLHRVAPQKKHQMFGKNQRAQPNETNIHPYPHSSSGLCIPYNQNSNASMDPLEMKYSCSIDFNRHGQDGPTEIHSNHSYSLPQSHLPTPNLSLRPPRPPTKTEKPKKEYLSRDEKRARSMQLPMNTDDIINLPMDEFNERLSKYDLSETQLSLIRDIRRRGKNKVAAQNCRKRKLDQIVQLADEVQKIRDRKHQLLRDQESLMSKRNHLKDKYAQLYRIVFQALRDANGNPISQNAYSLQQASDGNIVLVPRNTIQPSTSDPSHRGKPLNKDELKKDGQA